MPFLEINSADSVYVFLGWFFQDHVCCRIGWLIIDIFNFIIWRVLVWRACLIITLMGGIVLMLNFLIKEIVVNPKNG